MPIKVSTSQFNGHFACMLPLVVFAGSALGQTAQTAPDAGALRQQIERDANPALPRKTLPQLAPLPEPLKTLPGATVTLKSVRFVGNTLLSSEKLAPAVQGYLNKPQSFASLQEAAAAVAKIYRDAGWMVRAYLPRQDLTDGDLTIQIVEAVFSGASLEGAEPTRLKFSQVLSIFAAQQRTGQPVNADALDRALLLADDLPGVAVVGTLREGQNDAETGLALKMSDEPAFSGEVSVDNTGARSTGSERINANVLVNSPLGLGDLVSANLAHTSGSDYVRVGYSLPVGQDGLRVGVSASGLSYKIVSPEFAALDGRGRSSSQGLDAIYPLIRSRSRNLYLNANLDSKDFVNESNASVQSDYASTALSLGLSGNLFDSVGGGGANSASVALVAGNLALGSPQAGENPALEGSFSKLRYAVSRQQVLLRDDLSLYATLSGQQSGGKLDSSEKLSLGGASGVRAYPSGEGSGSSGQLAALELRWRLPQGFNLVGFYDWGSVSDPDSPSYSLKGVGLGLTWQTPIGASVKATWARRLGDNPNPTSTGVDQDGSLNLNRWWFAASLPF